MNNQEYNGWCNYATWKIASEVLNGMFFGEEVAPQELKEVTEEMIFEGVNNSLCENYARAFLAEVNYHEIADNINETLNNY